MKKIAPFLVLIVLLINSKTYSQSTTLEFKQVLLVTSQAQSVPAGHVWKIENILPSARLADANTTWDVTAGITNLDKVIVVAGQNVIVHSSSSTTKVQTQESSTTINIRSSNSGYGYSSGILNGAIWLPAGTSLAASTGVYAISVLEFALTP